MLLFEIGTKAVPEASWHVDGGTIGQRDHGADTGGCHQAPANVIVPDDGQQAAVQDAVLIPSCAGTSSPEAEWHVRRPCRRAGGAYLGRERRKCLVGFLSEASDEGLSTVGVRGQPTKWDKWYSTARWARIRKHQLLDHPLCKYCLERGIVTPATICDHVEPHHGDVNKFWLGPLQSLCKQCHDSTKRFVELHGFRPDIGLDGWPLDSRHPVYRMR